MKKILIIGIVASGKTTLAKQLSEKLHIPWHELDAIVHHQTATERYKRTPEAQVEEIMKIDKAGSWIFEGTDRQSYQCLYDMADTIIFLDPPLWKRKFRILTRFMKQKLHIEKCHYQPDFTMLKMMYQWTADFERNRSSFENKLKAYDHKTIILKDNTSVNLIVK